MDVSVADMISQATKLPGNSVLAARDLFCANKASKLIYLDNNFRQLLQGAFSIHEFCRHQKQIANSLSENDCPLSDHALVLNTLRGCGPRFASADTVMSDDMLHFNGFHASFSFGHAPF
jgi:hypothetical protein